MNQKERIIEQTMRMFVMQGIKSVRMDDIARQLGISKRTLYELFGDKENLLYLAMLCYFEQNRLRWNSLSSDAPNMLVRLFMVLSDVMEHSETTARMMENLRKFYPAVHAKLMREGSEKNRQDLRRMLEQGIADGLFIDRIDIELAITVLYYTASAITVRKDMLLPEDLSERSAFVQIVSTFFRGISTAEGLRIIDDFLNSGPAVSLRRTNS
ncbi:MAG: TetR/AcrR family transcriptional regulator [Alistipes sp.]|nr:TetR/AcrR family transcriptional regulator [Alistipes senegalensis]MCM1250074.1 TetR/AcrR family transcriptional regulator [Alistipes sp.]